MCCYLRSLIEQSMFTVLLFIAVEKFVPRITDSKFDSHVGPQILVLTSSLSVYQSQIQIDQSQIQICIPASVMSSEFFIITPLFSVRLKNL